MAIAAPTMGMATRCWRLAATSAAARCTGSGQGSGPEQRFEGRDLVVTTDFRDVFGEVIVRHLGLGDPAPVFPGHEIRESRFVGFLKG